MREADRERQKREWEMKERQAEEQRTREEELRRRQQEEMAMAIRRQEEELHRRQQENNLFLQVITSYFQRKQISRSQKISITNEILKKLFEKYVHRLHHKTITSYVFHNVFIFFYLLLAFIIIIIEA